MEKEKRSDLSAPQRYFLGTSTWETEREREREKRKKRNGLQNVSKPYKSMVSFLAQHCIACNLTPFHTLLLIVPDQP